MFGALYFPFDGMVIVINYKFSEDQDVLSHVASPGHN